MESTRRHWRICISWIPPIPSNRMLGSCSRKHEIYDEDKWEPTKAGFIGGCTIETRITGWLGYGRIYPKFVNELCRLEGMHQGHLKKSNTNDFFYWRPLAHKIRPSVIRRSAAQHSPYYRRAHKWETTLDSLSNSNVNSFDEFMQC